MEEYAQWMEKAEEDLATAQYNDKGERNTAAAFFAHQATEKALKAVFIKKENDLIKTHDLVLLAEKTRAPTKISTLCKQLNPLYLATRYPTIAPDEAFQKAKVYIAYAQEVLTWCHKQL
jgi:HEPN domain-containing protein